LGALLEREISSVCEREREKGVSGALVPSEAKRERERKDACGERRREGRIEEKLAVFFLSLSPILRFLLLSKHLRRIFFNSSSEKNVLIKACPAFFGMDFFIWRRRRRRSKQPSMSISRVVELPPLHVRRRLLRRRHRLVERKKGAPTLASRPLAASAAVPAVSVVASEAAAAVVVVVAAVF
jgi:hypothetical protein